MKKYIIMLSLMFMVVHGRDNLKSVFTNIYLNGVWGKNSEGLGTSGGGSTVKAAKEYMQIVEEFIKKNNIKSIVDAGCGDWEFSQFIDWTGIDYMGFDIVAHVIERNQEKFQTDSVRFYQANIIQVNLPAADLLLCKDVLQHLGTQEINVFLSQLKKYKYCLITDGPTINMFDRLKGFNRSVYAVYWGGEEKKIILINNDIEK